MIRKNLEPAKRKNLLDRLGMAVSAIVGPDFDTYWDAISWLRLRAKDACLKDENLRSALKAITKDYTELAAARRQKLEAVLTADQLDRLAALVDTAVMLEAENAVDDELMDRFGCQVCKNGYLSFERRREEQGPPCSVYGMIPLSCRSFERTVGCCECGTSTSDDALNEAKIDRLRVYCEKCTEAP